MRADIKGVLGTVRNNAVVTSNSRAVLIPSFKLLTCDIESIECHDLAKCFIDQVIVTALFIRNGHRPDVQNSDRCRNQGGEVEQTGHGKKRLR